MSVAKSSFTELPTIDISDLASDSLAKRQAVADTIGKAAREVGFFYITGHGIAPGLIAGIRAAAKALFALPMEQKMQYYIGHSRSHKGYVPEGEEIYGSGKPDHKEAFDIGFQAADDHPFVLAGTPLIVPTSGRNWRNFNPGCWPTMTRFSPLAIACLTPSPSPLACRKDISRRW